MFKFNVAAHPNAAWTLQQFREAINDQQGYRFLVHDRDSMYSQELALGVKAMGVRVLKTPFRSPQAYSYCERLIGVADHRKTYFFELAPLVNFG
jgi:putative transposase